MFFFLTTSDKSNERLGGKMWRYMYNNNKILRDKSVFFVVRNIFYERILDLFLFSRTNNVHIKQQIINYERVSGKPANGWTPPVGTKVTTVTYRG